MRIAAILLLMLAGCRHVQPLYLVCGPEPETVGEVRSVGVQTCTAPMPHDAAVSLAKSSGGVTRRVR